MISVVIPYLSGFDDLKKCISAIKGQNVRTEIIVVNDSGKDLKVNGVNIINHQHTKGAARSRNEGFANSIFDYVLFVDNDIILQPGSITKILRGIEKADIVFPKVVYENKRIMHPVGIEKEFPQISACFMIKKNSAKKMDELFDSNYQIYLEDADFFLRAKLFGLKTKYVDKAIAIHKLKKGYNEKRFYLENRNLLYGIIKFCCINKKGIYHPFKMRSWFSNFVCALFNFDKFDWSHYQREQGLSKKLKLLFWKHKKLSKKGSFFLLWQMIKAKLWLLFHIGIVLKKRKRFKSKL